MADERAGQDNDNRDGVKRVATDDKIQTEGRQENDARPLNSASDDGGPERYPSVRQDDAVERTGRIEEVTGGETRSFDPPRGAGPDQPGNAGKVGPDGKPAQDDTETKPTT